MIAMLLALTLQLGMTDSDYLSARARENPTVAQAQEVVTEAIRRGAACDPASEVECSGFGDSVIVTVLDAKRSECIIESAQRMTCLRSTQLSPYHVNFDPPSVTIADDELDIGAIRSAERAWVGLN